MIELSGHSSSWGGAREWQPSAPVFLQTFLLQKPHMCCLWRSIVCERKEKEQLGWTPHKKLHSLRCTTSVPGQTLIAVSQTILPLHQYWSLLYLSHMFCFSVYLNSLTSFCCDLSFCVFGLELLLIFPILHLIEYLVLLKMQNQATYCVACTFDSVSHTCIRPDSLSNL